MHSTYPIRAVRGAVLAIALLMLVACGGARARHDSHMARGMAYLAAGNLEKANVEFRNALQIEPKDAEALYQSAHVAELRGNLREAVALYQGAIDVNPDHVKARAGLARLLVLGGATERALYIIRPGLLAHPDDANLLAARAAARHQTKDDDGARADAQRAVQLAPSNEDAVAILAALDRDAGDTQSAVELVRRTVEQLPTSVAMRQVLASLYLAQGQPAQAEEQLRGVVRLKSEELAPRLVLARYYVQAGRTDDAEQVLLTAVRELPHGVQARLALIDFLAAQRSREQAEQRLRQFIAADPDDAELRFALGMLQQRAGAADEAIATYRQVIDRERMNPRGLAARDRIAALEAARGHRDSAAQLVAEVLRENPRDDDALILKADLDLERDDPAAAIVALRAVLRDQPRSAPLQRTLARAYLATGQPGLAEDALRTAIAAEPRDGGAAIELAQMLLQSGRNAQAVTLLQEAVHNSPGDPRLREALVRACIAQHDLPGARVAADDLIALAPKSSTGYYLAGLVALEQKHYDDAARQLERALELAPAGVEILRAQVRLDLARGTPALAIEHLRQRLDRDPANVAVLELLGALYRENRDLSHALATLERAAGHDSKSWSAHRELALVRLDMQQPDAAIAEYQSALKIAPSEPRLLTELAALYEKQGLIDQAIGCYDTLYSNPRLQQFAANNLAMLLVTHRSDAASLDRARDLTLGFGTSEDGSLLDTYGWVLFKRHAFEDALAALQRAADRAPDSREIRYHLGMVELQLGRREQARTDLENALSGAASFAGSAEARQTLASLEALSAG